jgi:hypothetical protein
MEPFTGDMKVDYWRQDMLIKLSFMRGMGRNDDCNMLNACSLFKNIGIMLNGNLFSSILLIHM